MRDIKYYRRQLDNIPIIEGEKRAQVLQEIVDIQETVIKNLSNRNSELIYADTVFTAQVALLLEQRFMLFTVLGDIKSALDKQGEADHIFNHMIFDVVNRVREMDAEWQEQHSYTNKEVEENDVS